MEVKLCDRDALPEDIIFDVLARLPVKSLCRFRCVCKGWRALISDPAFVAAQRSRAGPLVAAVFEARRPRRELRVMDLYGGEVFRSFEVATTLLANTHLDLICVDEAPHGATIIIDPASGRKFTVGRNENDSLARFGGPPAKSSFSDSSFGRATPSGAYKVLRLHQAIPRNGRGQLCEVATINNGDSGAAEPTWRQRSAPPFPTSSSCYRKASINGALYFMPGEYIYDHDPLPARRMRYRIAKFDLESEEWKKMIHYPREVGLQEGPSWTVALAELKGALIMVRKAQHHGHITIWLLADSNKSLWVKQYTIQMPNNWLLTTALDVLGDGRVLLLTSIKEDEICYRYRHVLQFYNPSTGAFTDLMEMPEGFTRMAFYTGSLLSSQIAVDI